MRWVSDLVSVSDSVVEECNNVVVEMSLDRMLVFNVAEGEKAWQQPTIPAETARAVNFIVV